MARKKTFVNVRLNESNVRHQRESKKLCMKDGKINGELTRSPELSEQDLISKMV